MTLVVLAIDALDPELVDHFDCEHMALEDYGRMETFAYTKEQPLTPEVWATVATGLHPDDHGIAKAGTSEWDNPVVDFLSNYTWTLGFWMRGRLGDLANSLLGAEYSIPVTDAESMFDRPGRVVHDWPGVVNMHWLEQVWETANPGEDGTTHGEFQRAVYGIAVQQFAWIKETLRHPCSLVGTHTHLLDMGGHIYAEDEEELGRMYRWVDEWVGDIRAAMGRDDELLILSDHGIVTPWSPDGDLDMSMHSWRAFSGSTFDSRPLDVYEVREWVERRVDDSAYDPGGTVDLPTEQLRDLGYID